MDGGAIEVWGGGGVYAKEVVGGRSTGGEGVCHEKHGAFNIFFGRDSKFFSPPLQLNSVIFWRGGVVEGE